MPYGGEIGIWTLNAKNLDLEGGGIENMHRLRGALDLL